MKNNESKMKSREILIIISIIIIIIIKTNWNEKNVFIYNFYVKIYFKYSSYKPAMLKFIIYCSSQKGTKNENTFKIKNSFFQLTWMCVSTTTRREREREREREKERAQ